MRRCRYRVSCAYTWLPLPVASVRRAMVQNPKEINGHTNHQSTGHNYTVKGPRGHRSSNRGGIKDTSWDTSPRNVGPEAGTGDEHNNNVGLGRVILDHISFPFGFSLPFRPFPWWWCPLAVLSAGWLVFPPTVPVEFGNVRTISLDRRRDSLVLVVVVRSGSFSFQGRTTRARSRTKRRERGPTHGPGC